MGLFLVLIEAVLVAGDRCCGRGLIEHIRLCFDEIPAKIGLKPEFVLFDLPQIGQGLLTGCSRRLLERFDLHQIALPRLPLLYG